MKANADEQAMTTTTTRRADEKATTTTSTMRRHEDGNDDSQVKSAQTRREAVSQITQVLGTDGVKTRVEYTAASAL